MRFFNMLILFIVSLLLVVSCNPEDEYLRKLYPKDSRKWAIQELIKMKDKIVDKDKTTTKLLNLDRTPEAGMAVMAVGEIGYPGAIPRIGEIADTCMKTLNVRNLKTLESIAIALGKIGDPQAIPILEKYFTIDTPEKLAGGQRLKPESVAKAAAVKALSKMPEEAKKFVPQIIKLMKAEEEDFGTKYTIAGVLGEFGDPRAVKPLVTALFYEEQGFSLFPEARKSLIRLGKYAENDLIKAYKDNNAAVNRFMNKNKKRAMKQFCPEYIDPKKRRKGECEKHEQLMATYAQIDTTKKLKTSIVLADIRSKKAVDMVIKELENQLAKVEKQPFLAEHLAVQLAKFGDFKATDTLLKMVSKDFAQKEIKRKRRRRGGRRLSKAEKKQAQLAKRGQEISIRMKGAEALAILGDKKALPFLLKAAMQEPDSEYNMKNEKIIFYEPVVWAADAYTRLTDDAAGAEEFIQRAKAFIKNGKAYVANVERQVKRVLTRRGRKKVKDLDKKVKAKARQDVNYDSTNKAVKMMERFITRAKLAKACKKDTACYAKKLTAKDPAHVEKAVYMIGFNGKMGEYKEQLKPVFVHKEPWVREAVSIALLKTEDKGFIPILDEVIESEGAKVEYAKSSKEFKAILSYLKSL